MNLFATIGLGYLIGTGAVTSGAVVGRGLLRAAKTALGGDVREAAVEVLGSLAAPAFVSYSTVAALYADVIETAQYLAAPALDEIDTVPLGRAA